jgi:hypothetical protein
LSGNLLTPELYVGVLFLCCLPSTVQSSIAFTSMARGNVAAAVCSASASNFIGIFVTPLLVSTLIVRGAASGSSWHAVVTIVEQLLLPFLAGQLLRPWIGAWVDRKKPMLKIVDQGSILLVVYTAFSESVNEGLWHKLSPSVLVTLGIVCAVMLAAGPGHRRLDQQAPRLRQGGRDHHRVLRLEKEPGQRGADGQGAVRAGGAGDGDPAGDAVSPDPADGVCGAGPALGAARQVNSGSEHIYQEIRGQSAFFCKPLKCFFRHPDVPAPRSAPGQPSKFLTGFFHKKCSDPEFRRKSALTPNF